MFNNYMEYVIEGDIYAQLSCYDKESGDGIASLSRDEQIKKVLKKY